MSVKQQLIQKLTNFVIFVQDDFTKIIDSKYYDKVMKKLTLIENPNEDTVAMLCVYADYFFKPEHAKNLLDGWVSHTSEEYDEKKHKKNNEELLKVAVYTQFGVLRENEATTVIKILKEKSNRDLVDKFIRYLQLFRLYLTKLNNAV